MVNTLPDNFLWEKDKGSILTVAPGLYEVIYENNLGYLRIFLLEETHCPIASKWGTAFISGQFSFLRDTS